MAVATKNRTKPATGKAESATAHKSGTPDAIAIARGKVAAKMATQAIRIWTDYAEEGDSGVRERLHKAFDKALANAYPSNPAT